MLSDVTIQHRVRLNFGVARCPATTKLQHDKNKATVMDGNSTHLNLSIFVTLPRPR